MVSELYLDLRIWYQNYIWIWEYGIRIILGFENMVSELYLDWKRGLSDILYPLYLMKVPFKLDYKSEKEFDEW